MKHKYSIKKIILIGLLLLCQFGAQSQVINTLFFKYPEWSEELENRAKTDFPAKVVVGYYYLVGKGVEKDGQTAFKWFNEAISQPHDDIGRAYNNLGYCYQNGIGVEVDNKKAFEYYYLAAMNNDNSYCNLAMCYELGEGTEKNIDEAIKWYTKCIKNGDPQGIRLSRVRMGYILAYELNDGKSAIPYLEAAAADNSATAFFFLGQIYEKGIAEMPIDYEKSLSYYKQSINTYEEIELTPDIITRIGDFYYEGKGTPQDKMKAKEMYESAAKRGGAVAKKRLNELTF